MLLLTSVTWPDLDLTPSLLSSPLAGDRWCAVPSAPPLPPSGPARGWCHEPAGRRAAATAGELSTASSWPGRRRCGQFWGPYLPLLPGRLTRRPVQSASSAEKNVIWICGNAFLLFVAEKIKYELFCTNNYFLSKAPQSNQTVCRRFFGQHIFFADSPTCHTTSQLTTQQHSSPVY